MKLIHYSDKYLTEIRDCDQKADSHASHIGKPIGLWVSVDGEDDWFAWCRGEGYCLENLGYPTEIALAADANILIVSTPQGIEDLTEKFGDYPTYAQTEYDRNLFGKGWIDWCAFGELFDGIIIAPYQWSHRLNNAARWYYSWDCASGCIWRARAVQSLTPLPFVEAASRREEAAE